MTKKNVAFAIVFLAGILPVLIGMVACVDRHSPGEHLDAQACSFGENCLAEHDSIHCLVRKMTSKAQEVFGDSSIDKAREYEVWLDSTAEKFREQSSSLSDSQKVVMLRSYVYEEANISFDPDRNDISGILPQEILQRDSGSCLGVSLLFLSLAEMLNLPIFGVLIPTHFFVRYENEAYRVNIEPNLGGYPRTDAYYRRQYGIEDSSWYDLTNRNIREVAGVAWFNLGNIFFDAGKIEPAIETYRCAIDHFPDFAEIQGNLGLAYDQAGKTHKAIEVLERARNLRPNLPNLARNLGIIYLKAGLSTKALHELKRAATQMPSDPEIHYGLAVALYREKRFSEAYQEVALALARRPQWDEASELKKKIQSRID